MRAFFNPATPTVYIAQGSPTQLSAAVQTGIGSLVFQSVGPPGNITYNAIGFNTADDFIYGVTGAATALPNHVIRIGQNGVYEDTGITIPALHGLNVGMFGPNGNFCVGTAGQRVLYQVNLTTMTVTTLSSRGTLDTLNSYDATEADGFFWGLYNAAGNVATITRINPVSGQVSNFPFRSSSASPVRPTSLAPPRSTTTATSSRSASRTRRIPPRRSPWSRGRPGPPTTTTTARRARACRRRRWTAKEPDPVPENNTPTATTDPEPVTPTPSPSPSPSPTPTPAPPPGVGPGLPNTGAEPAGGSGG